VLFRDPGKRDAAAGPRAAAPDGMWSVCSVAAFRSRHGYRVARPGRAPCRAVSRAPRSRAPRFAGSRLPRSPAAPAAWLGTGVAPSNHVPWARW